VELLDILVEFTLFTAAAAKNIVILYENKGWYLG